MTLGLGLDIPIDTVAAICHRFHIRRMAVFGSAARHGARPDSDVDLMVDFEPGYHPGLAWFDLEDELSAAFGRRVDLSQSSLLKPRIRSEAERDAVVLYAA